MMGKENRATEEADRSDWSQSKKLRQQAYRRGTATEGNCESSWVSEEEDGNFIGFKSLNPKAE